MATEAVAPTKSIQKYTASFVDYAKTNNLEINRAEFMAWDEKHNASAVANMWLKEHGEAGLKRIALLELYGRALTTFLTFKIDKGNPILPAGCPPTQLVQKKIYLPDATPAQQEFVLDGLTRRWKNDSRRMKMLGLSSSRLHKLLDEALNEA